MINIEKKDYQKLIGRKIRVNEKPETWNSDLNSNCPSQRHYPMDIVLTEIKDNEMVVVATCGNYGWALASLLEVSDLIDYKIGDTVKVVKKVNILPNCWVEKMNSYLGESFVIKDLDKEGVKLKNYYFSFESIEIVSLVEETITKTITDVNNSKESLIDKFFLYVETVHQVKDVKVFGDTTMIYDGIIWIDSSKVIFEN